MTSKVSNPLKTEDAARQGDPPGLPLQCTRLGEGLDDALSPACYGGLLGLSGIRNANVKATDVWLHSGAALGDAVDASGEDYYRLLKHETAVEGLKLLDFGAMVRTPSARLQRP